MTASSQGAATREVSRVDDKPRRRLALEALPYLAPFAILYGVFLIYPLGKGLWISLYDWELVGTHRAFIGLDNYRALLTDALFWKAIRNTIVFVLITVPCMTVLALGLALAVNGPARLNGVLRGIFFASSVFSVSVVTLIWQMVLNGDRGLIAHLLQDIGLRPIAFLGSPYWAMPSLVVATLWWGVGLPLALFLAGLKQIPLELYEAAELDGASRWTVLRRITLPALRRTTLLVVVLQLVAQFQMFGQSELMTKGGPANGTLTVVQYIYQTGFRDWQIGAAAAMAMILFCLMFAFSMLQLWLGRAED